jgi:predicted nucleotidyltransferase component of viral defense system
MREPRNTAASVRARLRNVAAKRNEPVELLLTLYVLERLLYRLSTTEHRKRFVLKGAMLMRMWFDLPFRPTRDLDLLGFGDPDPEAMLSIFRGICSIELDDGVQFNAQGLRIHRIREDNEYGGLRLKTIATLAGARVPVTVDVGFGDAVEPEIADVELPVLLDLPPPRLYAYPRETVIAEKFQAMVYLGRANSRMKDFYDVWLLSLAYKFEGESLPRAIAATFARRNTAIPSECPDALTAAFAEDPVKQQQWTSFLRDIDAPFVPLAEALEALKAFLMPHAEAARTKTA